MVNLVKLSKEDYYYDICSLSKKEMEKFLIEARKNWKKAVQKAKISDYMKDMILNEKVRGKLVGFMEKELKIAKKSKVLDIGAGMGALTLAIARRFKTSATDANLLSLKFVKYRAEQEKVRLNLYKTSPLHKGLPFKKESFDVVVMNGVLEWVAVGFPNIGRVKKVQEKVLKEVNRILKEKGILILAIENRLAIDWFKGKTSHTNIKYIDLVPRRIADIISLIKTRRRFKNYIYSKRGYKKLLRKTDFSDLIFYEAFPNYQKPQKIRKTRNLFINSFIIVARKEGNKDGTKRRRSKKRI